MDDRKMRKKFLWLTLAVFWMGVIFYFSSQEEEVSGAVSSTVTYQMAECANTVMHLDWEEDTLVKYAVMWEHPVRKMAHMTEYAVFACILLGNFAQYPFGRLAGEDSGAALGLSRWKYMLAEAGAIAYAATDEFHQLFVDGRSGQFSDVCIDGTGALIGLLLAFAVQSIRRRASRGGGG